MKKRLAAVLLTLCMVLSLMPTGVLAESTATSGKCGDNLTWKLENGTLTISGTGPMYNYSGDADNIAPWSYMDAKTVQIEKGVTTIGDYAFARTGGYTVTSVTSVTIPDTVTRIGNDAFSDCSLLTSLDIPNSVTTIGNRAFMACSQLEHITIPASVTNIAESKLDVWNDNDGDTTVLITETWPFSGCQSLQSIDVAEDNPNYSSYDGVLYDKAGKRLIGCPEGKWGSYQIPEGVLTIDDGAFMSSPLSEVIFPYGLIQIGHAAFLWMFNMTSATIPDSVVYIGKYGLGYDNLDNFVQGQKAGSKIKASGGVKDNYQINGYTHSDAQLYAAENDCKFIAMGQGRSNFADNENRNEWYYAPIRWAANEEITTGKTTTEFVPGDSCTRAQAVTFLWRAAGSPEPASANNPFTDVSEGEYYYKAVLWAVEQGITKGTSETEFSPNATCNRAQIVTFLHRYEGAPAAEGGGFNDVPASEYYYAPVIWAVSRGVTNGTGDGNFSPMDNCTRGQIVTFLYRDMVG